MKRLLYATGNSSKVYTMRRRLAGQMVEVLTLADAGVQLHVEENGATPVENALIKARAYYAATEIPAIAGDSAFYIDGLPAAQQPGLHVRRVDGRELSDEELIIHYAALARGMGGSVPARFVTGMALVDASGEKTVLIQESTRLLTDHPLKDYPHQGDPLAALCIDPGTGKYIAQLTDAEELALDEPFEKACMAFLREALAE